ncbi:L-asparaginase [Aplysia californica]|uniref:asparaginase n=1 Tax=Aplysia californica TaxID=6500 RepID=A0ABM1VX02_APLCA|nr:L-asparaginase [Aplysia californica]
MMEREDSTQSLQKATALLERSASTSSEGFNVAKVLVIYSGGTIGMVNKSGGYEPQPNCMIEKLKAMPIFHCPESRSYLTEKGMEDFLILQVSNVTRPSAKDRRHVVYKVVEFDPLLDSSNMSITDWVKVASCIKENYHDYDGFVILHGTDTMAYSASALSFMCENLGKTIILTGSQIPIYETRSDGRDNFLASLIIAGNYIIPEVLICFNEKVFRGNRCIKSDSGSFSAFSSPNMPPLVTLEIEIKVDWTAVFRPTEKERFVIHTNMCPNVGLLRLFPGITSQTVRAFLQPPVQGVVLQTYGAGNAPNNRTDLLTLFKEACQWGVLIVNISQCSRGNVGTAYATGVALQEAGVIFGGDMTPEAALTKLSYVLGKDEWSLEQKKKMLARNLRGELTTVTEEKLSISDSELIKSVARYMSLSTREEVNKVKEAIYPCLMCAAAQANDVPALEKLRSSGGDLGMENQDGRTALHVACRHGHINTVHYLLGQGVSVHKKDYRGETPLIDAIEGGHPDIIRLLIKTGSSIPLPEGQVAVRMCSAVAKGDIKAVEMWLLGGAKPNWYDYDQRTPLHVAISLDKKEVASLLIKGGASVDVEDVFGNTPAIIAQKLGYDDLMPLISGVVNGTAKDSNGEGGT